jgi:membrane-bound metal-dependent hydrolase YbcI (DUF457 family)
VYLLAFGTLVPDLVDKPLSWTLSVLEAGRSLGHSLVVGGIVMAVLYLFLAPRIGRAPLLAFGIGYVSHPIADLPFQEIVAGNFEFTTYLVWPLLSPPPYDEAGRTIISYLLSYEPGAYDLFQLGLFVLALWVWYVDGCPGLTSSPP